MEKSKLMQKAYKLHSLAIYSISSANLYQGREKQTQKLLFCSSSFFSFFDQHNSKTTWCMRILYIPSKWFASGNFLCFWFRVVYEQWLASNGLRHLACSVVNFWGFYSIILGLVRIIRQHPDYWTRGTVQKFDYSFLYLLFLEDQYSANENTVVVLGTFWISSTW